MPAGWKLGRISAVAVDLAGEVYVFHRGAKADPIIVFDDQGRYLRSWGRGMFGTPHGMRIDPEGHIWITDSADHQVMKFTREGRLLLTLDQKKQPGATEKTFNRPTDIAFTPAGDFYISDGYGNARVVKFSRAGQWLLTWGEPGTGPGQFNTPHSLVLDSQGQVYVSDRENNRLQVFDAEGRFLRQWRHLGATQGLYMTATDELWIMTHRNNIENATYDTLAGRIMRINPSNGHILGSMESPGHWIHVTPGHEIFIASLTGNVFRWTPGWLENSQE